MATDDKAEPHLVPVLIMGQTYTVRAEQDGRYIEELARFVDTKITTISEATGTSESLKVAILAALNIADELFRANEAARSSDEQLSSRIAELSDKLEKSLREPTQTTPV